MDQALEGCELGWARVRALHRHLLAAPDPAPAAAALPGSQPDQLAGWAQGFAREGLLGLDPSGISPGYLASLGWAGMPLAAHGSARWGEQVRIPAPGQAPRALPEVRNEVLWLPTAERLRACSGIRLRPLRAFVAQAWAGRLQAAGGLQRFAWRDATLLVSTRAVVLHGFLHGPRPGSRAAFRLAPGDWLLTTW